MEDNIEKYNFWCQDCNCGAKSSKQNFVIPLPSGSGETEECYCPNNNSKDALPLKCMGVVTFGVFSKVSLMNKQQKQQMFKKRSHEHFKKHLEENKKDIIKRSNPFKR